MKTLLFFFILLLITNYPAQAQVSVGDDAPDFSLQVLGESQGTTISLSDLNGKVVFLFFYGANCPHCRNNGGNTEFEINEVFKVDTNFVILGLDTWNNNVPSNNSFRGVTQITYPQLLNARSVGDTYFNYFAYDRAIVINDEGKVVYKGSSDLRIDNGEIGRVKNSITEALSMVSTSSGPTSQLPSSVKLDPNYPNPFNPSTTISYEISSPSQVTLQIFNVLGKEVATLVNEFQNTGNQTTTWDASSVPSGIYMYRLTVGNEVLTRRMMLIK